MRLLMMAKENIMDFELHLERHDGTVHIEVFRRNTLDEAWVHAAGFMGEFKAVIKMVNKTAVRQYELRGSKN